MSVIEIVKNPVYIPQNPRQRGELVRSHRHHCCFPNAPLLLEGAHLAVQVEERAQERACAYPRLQDCRAVMLLRVRALQTPHQLSAFSLEAIVEEVRGRPKA